MDRAEWLKRVGALTYRTYTETEGDVIEELAWGRLFLELRTPWNQFYTLATANQFGGIALDARARIIRGAGWVDSGGMAHILPQITLEEAFAISHNEVRGSMPREGWFLNNTGQNPPYTPGLNIAPSSLVVDDGVGRTDSVVVYYWGQPADPFTLYEFLPQLLLWAGAVEGFQLSGDEAGRERALRMFAAELDNANIRGEEVGNDYGNVRAG